MSGEDEGAVPSQDGHEDVTRAAALSLWEEAQPARGTPVEAYLSALGCRISTLAPDALRFHPECPLEGFNGPTMLAPMRNITTREIVGVYITPLRADGPARQRFPHGMSPKPTLGRAAGAAVMLRPRTTVLGIAQGIENAISASIIFDIPTWAVVTSTDIHHFPVVHGTTLTIFADSDPAGHDASRNCAERYSEVGLRTRIYLKDAGTSWNDYLLRRHP